MHTCTNLYSKLCSYENLGLAYRKARKHKTTRKYVVEFEADLENNILQLQKELMAQEYRPRPRETFTLRDPKTRKISKSDFRDRVVHHAICNIIEPIFDKTFIYDSYANRKGKGTINAIKRFVNFKRKITQNNTKQAFILKADILRYFDSVDHNILLSIVGKRIKDSQVLSLIRIVLENHKIKRKGKGMPLGNLTSQFFANLYLNELDYFVKHTIGAKYYIRYVDDFVVLHESKTELTKCLQLLNCFLKENLSVQLHPDKSKIFSVNQGVPFLGLRVYPHYRLLKKGNIIKFNKKLQALRNDYKCCAANYDAIYDFVEGWVAYSKQANTYNLRKRMLNLLWEQFAGEVSTKEFNRLEKDSKINCSFNIAP